MLPGIDGREVLQRIRRQNTWVPVLVLTARDAIEDKVRSSKLAPRLPHQAVCLCRIAGTHQGAAAARAGQPLEHAHFADLELDRLTQQVKRAGKRIELTAKEYSLLEYMMLNPGRVLSRNMIIEHVWDQSFDGITNIVDVYVRHLRAK